MTRGDAADYPASAIIPATCGRQNAIRPIIACDAFELRFAKPPYFAGWRDAKVDIEKEARNSETGAKEMRVYAGQHAVKAAFHQRIIPAVFVLALDRKNKRQAMTSSDRKKLLSIRDRINKVYAQFEFVSYDAAVKAYKRQMETFRKAVHADTLSVVPPQQTREEIDEEFSRRRVALKQVAREIHQEALPVLKEVASRLQGMARDLAVETDNRERASAEEFHMQYVPSEVLMSAIWMGVTPLETHLSQFPEWAKILMDTEV